MRNYRVKVRDDKAAFFEELMRYLDFLDYETVEGFSEPRIYSGFEIRPKSKKTTGESKNSGRSKDKLPFDPDSGFSSLREVMDKIDAMRDRSKK